MKKQAVMFVLVFLVVFSSMAQESLPQDDCNWLCQVVDWFSGTEKVVEA